jgi:cellobiose phosphorylase
VFIAGLFVLAAKEMAELTQRMKEEGRNSQLLPASPESYLDSARTMEATIWSHGWDGDWFRRAYDDLGHVLGSQDNKEGQIFVEPQGICVMAGLGVEDGRA